MKKYFSFFRLRFSMGLQYRTAALAGIITQFAWGLMEILVFRAFYAADPEAFPMTFAATVSYIWMQQAFLALFAPWMLEFELFANIMDGNIAYELCRPINLYDMWLSRSVANRLSRAVLRCFPILIVAVFIPAPYGLCPPASLLHFLVFLFTLVMGLLVTAAFCMIVYGLSFFTLSPSGIRMVFTSGVELLSGAVIPLPFFPTGIRRILEGLPFAAMQNVPLRIYSGDITGTEMKQAVLLQIFWLVVLVVIGRKLFANAEQKVTVQGG